MTLNRPALAETWTIRTLKLPTGVAQQAQVIVSIKLILPLGFKRPNLRRNPRKIEKRCLLSHLASFKTSSPKSERT
jgi:hypothetical protein